MYFLNTNKMFFMFILFFSSLISISSNSWLGCWIGMEINLLSFIPIITNSYNLLSSEASLKYFLTQSIASMNFLFIIIMNMMNFNLFKYSDFSSIMINITLLMKMGGAPLHFWFPNIMEGLSWMNCLLLMTWQKITPMILMSYYYNLMFLFMSMTMSIIIGSIGGFNQTSLRKLLAFSSINNLGWLISTIMMSNIYWNIYFIIYLYMMIMMTMLFYKLNITYLNQLFFSNFKKMIKLIIFLNLLSLGGLPPFMGFFPKWIIINFMMFNNMFILTFIFIMSALITLFFYIRLTYSSFMIYYLKLKWFKIYLNNNNMNFIYLFTFISLFTLSFSMMLPPLF
uniref:NADH dehydrogenase subunit 2 n=1 Tax=Morophaga formosana TaxID=1983356 RepID=UPI0022FD614B|nr:NADH dehydrogenase subunit 2 [Morophaga formosana]WAU48132.1 NADH dehydrogenase subunit 2 [Morophaga formosana]